MRKLSQLLFLVSLSVFGVMTFVSGAAADSITQANLSTPPNGWVRVAPNFVLASPQIIVTTTDSGSPIWPLHPNNVLTQVDFSTVLGAAAGIPHVLLISVIDNVGNAGINIESVVHTASYWDAGSTELDPISSTFTGNNTLGNGSAGRMAHKLMVPVDATSKGYIKANDYHSGATNSAQYVTIVGYWD